MKPMILDRHQHGMSLIELMVGIAIGLFILAGLTALFVNTSAARSEMEKSSRQIENGRYASELLRDDIQLAGFYDLTGLYVASAYSRTEPCDTTTLGFATSPNAVVPVPIYGYNNSWVGAGECGSFTSSGVNYRSGTDVLVVRRVATTTAIAPSAVASDSKKYLQTSACASDPISTPFIVASGSAAGTLTLKNKFCSGLQPVRALVSRIYFVANCNVCTGTSADSTPTLKVLELQGGSIIAVPLAEGIENLQLEYRLDNDGDGVIDSFGVKANTITDDCTSLCWTNVMGVDVYLLARNTEPTAGYQDSRSYLLGSDTTTDTISIANADKAFKHHVFNMSIRATNNAIQREAP